MARNGFKPIITDIPFDPDVVLDTMQMLPMDKNSLVENGVLFVNNRFNEVGKNTGSITMPAFIFDENDTDEDWDGLKDGSTSKLPNTSQTSVVVSRYKAWEINDLANNISDGVSPESAVVNYVQSFRQKQTFGIVKSVLKGMFANTSIQSKLIYDISTRSAKTNDFLKARTFFWGDQADAPVFYIMHSVVHASLLSALTETTMVNFLQGAKIIVDDKITTESAGVYETYIFRRNAMATSNDLAGSRAFRQTDEIKDQGTDVIGYKRRLILSPVGVSFKGTLAKPTGATTAELETGTNWELLKDLPDNHRYVRVGVIKSKESIDPADALEMLQKKAVKTE